MSVAAASASMTETEFDMTELAELLRTILEMCQKVFKVNKVLMSQLVIKVNNDQKKPGKRVQLLVKVNSRNSCYVKIAVDQNNTMMTKSRGQKTKLNCRLEH